MNVLKEKLKEVVHVELGGNPFIENQIVDTKFAGALNSKLRSLTVVYGPEGVGKSTYIRKCAQKYIDQCCAPIKVY